MSTKTKCKDLLIPQKTTKTYEIKVLKNQQAESIVGWKLYFTVKENMNDSDTDAKIKKDITELSDPTNGVALIELSSSDTDLAPKSYWYDIKYISATDESGILLKGKLTIEKAVTQRA